MKRLGSLVCIIATSLLLASCFNSRQARKYESNINGNWQLQTVTTEGVTGKVKAQLLNEADLACFVGSTWNFNRNNNLGTYSINKNGNECVAVKRNLRWSIYESNDEPPLFQFKKLDDNLKEIDEGHAGYRFSILEITDNMMKLRNDVSFEGKEISFIYNFLRI